jgi:hypothetical protein
MSTAPPTNRAVLTVRILTLVSVALAVMCAFLAHAWKTERDTAACWRAAAEFQLQPEGECRG